ncbi:hypothetical protein KLK06_11580 [Nonomuraea sp. NEAU-A123]|nr:hypothetical protein [Nonomuraea sp. NEAU-A123]
MRSASAGGAEGRKKSGDPQRGIHAMSPAAETGANALSIVRATVNAHDADIATVARAEGGLDITVIFPLA